MKRILPAILLLAVLAAPSPASPAETSMAGLGGAGRIYLVLNDGSEPIEGDGLLPLGGGMIQVVNGVGTRAAGVPESSIDWRETFYRNQSAIGGKALYIGGDRYIAYQSLRLDEAKDQVVLGLDNRREVRFPAASVDYRTTIIEARGLRLSAPPAPQGALLPRKTPAAGGSPASTARPGGRPGAAAPTYPPRPVLEPPPGSEDDDYEPPDDSGTVVERPDESDPTFNPLDTPIPEPVAPPAPRGPEGGPGSTPPRFSRAEVLTRVEPTYDASLVPSGPGYTALFEVVVAPDGTVSNVKIVKSSGVPNLDQAGIDALKQWTYKPADKDGVPYESRKLERLVFRGDGGGGSK